MQANQSNTKPDSTFFLRYFVGHRGKYGHEFIEYSVDNSGALRYINGTNYKKDGQLSCSAICDKSIVECVVDQVRKSNLLECDDTNWPYPDKGGRQELEIVIDNKHYSFVTCKLNSSEEIQFRGYQHDIEQFYKLVLEIRSFFTNLIQIHTQESPI